ncbi:MAG: alkaline phosphatase family protein [Vicinamibacterales bacterium]
MRSLARLRWSFVVLGAWIAMGCGDPPPSSGRRVIVLGFDGLDYALTRQMIDEGQLPAFARLAGTGGFEPLATSIPPQSPVAWSSFITGLDPGGHGIFDFVHRDPQTMLPFLSTTKTEGDEHAIGVGSWQIPLSGGRVELLREGRPFWDVLESHGVPTTIVRMPANFPPSGTATRELSGMGTPDLLGTYGTFAYYTSEPYAFVGQTLSGGVVKAVRVRSGVVRATLQGPDNPFRSAPEPVEAPFEARLDDASQYVKLVVGDEERLLAVGEWSDWCPCASRSRRRRHSAARSGSSSRASTRSSSCTPAPSTSIRSTRPCPSRRRRTMPHAWRTPPDASTRRVCPRTPTASRRVSCPRTSSCSRRALRATKCFASTTSS